MQRTTAVDARLHVNIESDLIVKHEQYLTENLMGSQRNASYDATTTRQSDGQRRWRIHEHNRPRMREQRQ
jgi:hypothetical protein